MGYFTDLLIIIWLFNQPSWLAMIAGVLLITGSLCLLHYLLFNKKQETTNEKN